MIGGDTPIPELGLAQIAVRCLVIYSVGLCAVRMGKSRLLSRASPLDLILAYILGSLLSRTLVALHSLVTALACRFHWVGNFVKGREYVLITDGLVHHDNLRRSHISERDLLEEMRRNANIERPEQVKVA